MRPLSTEQIKFARKYAVAFPNMSDAEIAKAIGTDNTPSVTRQVQEARRG